MEEARLFDYRKLKNKAKQLRRKSEETEATLRGINYNQVQSGKVSSKYINGNKDIESILIKKDEMIQEASNYEKQANLIYEVVEELKEEPNGADLFNVINYRYFEKKSFIQIGLLMEHIEISTIYRRRKTALKILLDK